MALSFDSVYYFNQRPDVLAAWQASDLSLSPYEFAVAHYDAFGWREGANPNKMFNTDEYLDAWPDLVVAGVNPFNHFNEFGFSEGRAPNASTPGLNDFDWELYLSKNSDLTDAGITTKEAAYDHYLNFGYAENRPGTPGDIDVQLIDALENLASANADLADFMDAGRANEILINNQGITDASSDADVIAAIDDELIDAAAALETSTRLTDFGDRSEALQNEAIADTRAALTKVVTDLNADIAGVQGLGAAVRLYNAAKAADTAATAALTAAGTKSLADLAAFNVLNGGSSYAGDGAGAEGLDDIENVTKVEDGGVVIISKNTAGRFVLESGVTEATHNGVTALLNSLNSNLSAYTAADSADKALNDSVTGAAANLALFDAKVAADAELSGRGFATGEDVADALTLANDDVTTFNDEVARFEAAMDLANELENLNDAIAAAEQAFEDMGYEIPEIIFATPGGVVVGTDDADIFVYDADSGTINGFDIDDALYFSGAFKSQMLDASDNMNGNVAFGDIAGLEIFLQQVGANTVVYVENNTYDGQQNGTWAGETITLVGVDASSLVFDNGFLRIADAVA